jgi:tellurium resistance protein TerD
MSFQLLVKQLTKNVPPEKFWLGFVVRYWKTVETKSVPCCEAVEISSLGLTLAQENRERSGFTFPVPLWHKNRFPSPDTNTIVPRFYIGINDPDLVFPHCRIFDSVDFVFAAKNGMTLSELSGSTSITVFTTDKPDGICLDIYDSFSHAKAVRIPLIEKNKAEKRVFCRVDQLTEIDEYPGEIDSYCHQHANLLKGPDSSVNTKIEPKFESKSESKSEPKPPIQSNSEIVLVRGQNTELEKNSHGLTHITIELGWLAPMLLDANVEIDPTVFLLQENGEVRDDHDFIFFNNSKSTCHSVELISSNLTDASGFKKADFVVSLSTVPSDIQKMAFCLTIDGPGSKDFFFKHVRKAHMRIINKNNMQGLYRFDLKADDIQGTEKTLIIGEIYRYRKGWKFKAISQGFAQGLEKLCKHHGVKVIDNAN